MADYAASGLNGIYLPESNLSGGLCTIGQLASAAHTLAGYVAVGADSGTPPSGHSTNTNLIVRTYEARDWGPDHDRRGDALRAQHGRRH